MNTDLAQRGAVLRRRVAAARMVLLFFWWLFLVASRGAASSAVQVQQVQRCGLQHVESFVEGCCASEQLRRSERVLCAELYTHGRYAVCYMPAKRSKALARLA